MKFWKIEGLDGKMLGEFDSRDAAIQEFLTYWPNFDLNSIDPFMYEEEVELICHGDPPNIIFIKKHLVSHKRVLAVLNHTRDWYLNTYFDGQVSLHTVNELVAHRISLDWEINWNKINDIKNLSHIRRSHTHLH